MTDNNFTYADTLERAGKERDNELKHTQPSFQAAQDAARQGKKFAGPVQEGKSPFSTTMTPQTPNRPKTKDSKQ